MLVGLAAIFMPGAVLAALAILFGAQLIVGSLFLFVGAFAFPAESGWLRPVLAVLAALSFVVGVYLVRHLLVSLAVLAFVLGVYWMAHGVIHLFVAIGHSELPGRIWLLASAVLSVLVGAFVFLFPGLSLVALTLVLGIWLIVYGALLIVAALRTRAAMQRASAQPARLSPT